MSVYLPPDPCRRMPLQGSFETLPIYFVPNSISQNFLDTVIDTLSGLPPALLQIIANGGFFLILSNLMSDVHPEERFQKPRGHHQDAKLDDLNGQCCVPQRHIHVTESSSKGVSRDAASTLRHELGHAFDSSVGSAIGFGSREVSLTYDFNQVYLQDVAQIDHYQQKSLAYYIQKRSPAGRSEAFAEAVASLIGGGCTDPGYFRHNFPGTVHWIEQYIFYRLKIQ